MTKKSKIKLILSIIILSLITGGVVLPLNFVFAQSYKVEFSDWMQPWGNPGGTQSYMEGSINLSYNGRYEVRTYYGANSGRGQLFEEYKVLVGGKYIGQTSDPNATADGPDYENEYLGEHDFNAGNHNVRLEHLWNYSQVGSQSVHPQNVTFTLKKIINNPPVADAGPDKEVYEDESVRLDGSGSDPDGDPITYYWSCTGGYISNRYTARPTFDAPSVSYDRSYTCTLRVSDDKGLSDSDSMRVRVLNQEESTACSKTSSSCSNPDGYIYLGDTKTGCLNNGDWKYYKVRESSGKKIKVELSWSRTGCNVNDLYIYKSNCSKIYSEENNNWTKTWQGTPSSDIIIGLDGDSSNDNCQWDLEVRSIGEAELTVKKSVKNVSRGDTEWYNIYRSADPSDELLFKIVVKSTGDVKAENVKVRDTLPSKIIYQGNLRVNNVSKSKNITTGAVSIGDLSSGESKTITFEAKVAAKEKFSFGTTDLINTARAYNDEASDTDTCEVRVTRKKVAGVVTGITNGILDSILLPLGIALAIVWVFKSKFIGLDKWTGERKKEIGEYRAKKSLKRKISRLKSRGTL